jgi:hypothetical protein
VYTAPVASYLSVLSVSSKFKADGEMVAIMAVRELPPKLSFRSLFAVVHVCMYACVARAHGE